MMTDPGTTTSRLQQLLSAAFGELTLLMTQVHAVLSDPSRAQKFVYQDDGLQLFAASVVLHLRPTEVAQLILDDGVAVVAEAFRSQFGRPILESEQVQNFANPSGTGSWAAFHDWTQSLWRTIEQQPSFTADIDHLVGEVFDHSKGYNRAINFAQQPTVAGLVDAPTLASTLTTPAPDPTKAQECGMWLYEGLRKAGLIKSEQSVSWTDFEDAARANWTTIASALGDATLTMDTVLTTSMRSELEGLGLVS